MDKSKVINSIYYQLKPLIPRRFQIWLRRKVTLRKRQAFLNVWPILEESSRHPNGWCGWPDQKRFALVLTHDVDTAKGQEKCHELIDIEERLGFRSSFNFVPERYDVSSELRRYLTSNGFEVGVHGFKHDGKLFPSIKVFRKRAIKINHYLKEWGSVGFRSPAMHHDLNLLHDLNIEYDASTFDTDPFEPQPESVGTIFPFWVHNNLNQKGYVELPYTLPQDFTLFVLMKEHNIDIWKKKLEWIAAKGGMALLNTHPDYMSFDSKTDCNDTYPYKYYEEFLNHVKKVFEGQYWHALPRGVARFYMSNIDQIDHCLPKSQKYNFKQIKKNTVWIDLDNSPHVPFFNPIKKELDKHGYKVTFTARDCFQVCGLADLFSFRYRRIGRHYGKNKALKVVGTLIRSFQLLPTALKEKPALSLSHGSRSQLITASMLRIPSVIIFDYEYTQALGFIVPDWVIGPELIPDRDIACDKNHTLRYPGLKEDVYVPSFKPDPTILNRLGIKKEDLVVTIRPPATEAHYHNPESEKLFFEVVELLGHNPDVRIVILPRNEIKQTAWIKNTWSEWCDTKKIIIPDHVVNGLDLIWYSDFVVSGGGTMNREAAALGVPVYSIFRGKIGAVDRYLSDNGRLTLLESVEDVKTKIKIAHRDKSSKGLRDSHEALEKIVANLLWILNKS